MFTPVISSVRLSATVVLSGDNKPAAKNSRCTEVLVPGTRGVDPYGTGGMRPPQYLDWGDSIMNVHPNILRVTSVTFHPCNMFFCLHRHSETDNYSFPVVCGAFDHFFCV